MKVGMLTWRSCRRVIGVTLISVKWLLEQGWYFTIAVLRTVRVREDELDVGLG